MTKHTSPPEGWRGGREPRGLRRGGFAARVTRGAWGVVADAVLVWLTHQPPLPDEAAVSEGATAGARAAATDPRGISRAAGRRGPREAHDGPGERPAPTRGRAEREGEARGGGPGAGARPADAASQPDVAVQPLAVEEVGVRR